jgi:hypothetical protein
MGGSECYGASRGFGQVAAEGNNLSENGAEDARIETRLWGLARAGQIDGERSGQDERKVVRSNFSHSNLLARWGNSI